MSRGKLLGAITLAMMVLVLGASQVQAVPIFGGIAFGGDAAPNTNDWDTATAVLFGRAPNSVVTSVTGAYIVFVPFVTTATFYDFTFSPTLDPNPVAPLWQTTCERAWFHLATVYIVNQGNDALQLRGTGTLYLHGYDPTPGQWDFTGQETGGMFSFSASNAAVPEPGLLLLLGLGLIGAAAAVRIRR